MARKEVAEETRLQVFVGREVTKRLDQLANDLGVSRNQMASWLLDAATSDVEWAMHSMVIKMKKAFGIPLQGLGAKKVQRDVESES